MHAASSLSHAGHADPALQALAERSHALGYEAQELAREVHAYAGDIEADPARLQQVEERLDLLGRLKRKHGGSIADVLAHAERCRQDHLLLTDAGETTARLEEDLRRRNEGLEALARKLRTKREKAATALEIAVRKELDQLGMSESSFIAGVDPRDEFGPRGADAVEFLLAPNRGVPPGPIREIASGGEMSRVMLALMSVATTVVGAPTVIFDEVDAGVGGNTARTVGERLRTLAERRQVVCITHLPQVASLAGRHFRVEKTGAGTDTPRTEVAELAKKDLVVEICRMLGSDAGDRAARQHAERLLEAA
jgi:DNA repair protein RecN (Recombination protein N)